MLIKPMHQAEKMFKVKAVLKYLLTVKRLLSKVDERQSAETNGERMPSLRNVRRLNAHARTVDLSHVNIYQVRQVHFVILPSLVFIGVPVLSAS